MSKRKTTEQFIEEAHKVHGYKYDYSKVEYINNKIKVCIICPIHGEFWQIPDNHLKGFGCSSCTNNMKYNNESFINKSNIIHNFKYDYSKVEYINNKIKVCIICPKHGEFWQRPDKHLNGQGCSKCATEYANLLRKYDNSIFIEKSKNIHNDKYDYSKVEYLNNHTKVCIICPIHGEFWQKPNDHLRGVGCSKCNESHLEKTVCNILLENDIIFERQKRFEWLGKQSLDFYLPDYNIGIECQGRQHFEPIDFFGGEKGYDEIVERDKRKLQLCIENKIKLIYFASDKRIKNDIINDFNDILTLLKNE